MRAPAAIRLAATAGALLALASCARHPLAGTSVAEPPPVVRIFATDRGFVVPRRIEGGIVELRLVNHSHLMHEAVLEHFFTANGNAAAFVDSVEAGVDVPAFAEDFGGPGLVLPGESTTVWLDLKPGHYCVMCWYPGHLRTRESRDFEVVAGQGHSSPPPTDLTVKMADFAYIFEGTWSAGSHRVLVQNVGSEEHEFDPYRLEPGRTVADFLHWVENHRKGPAPARALGGSGTFPPGGRVWLPLTLTPGRYFAFCQMPAKIGGKPHWELGMVREFEVK